MDGGDDDQRDERTTSPKNVCWLYYLCVVCFLVVVISLVSHMLHGYGRGTRASNRFSLDHQQFFFFL